MTVKRLDATHTTDYFQLRLEALKLDSSAFGASFEEELAQGEGHFQKILSQTGDDNVIFGAFDQQKLIGIIGILLPHRKKMRHKATIWGMYVNAAYRGKGFGGKLMDAAIAHARHQMNAKVIGLTVESTNMAGLALYRSRGFYVWGTEKKAMLQDGQFTDEDHMDLEL